MNIYLENSKFEYELRTLIHNNAELLSYFKFCNLKELKPHAGSRTNYIVFRRDCLEQDVVVCEGNLKNSCINLYDLIRTNEKTEKNSYKRLFYQLLALFFEFQLDWGILTGIRPTKLYHEYIRTQDKKIDVNTKFSEDLYVSGNKINILSQIYNTQKSLLSNTKSSDYSIYISVPFCPSKCSYCTFYSNNVNLKSKWIIPYIRTLEKEMMSVLSNPWVANKKIDTLYFGGGTPSSLDLNELSLFLKTVHNVVDFSKVSEITFEAGRPDTIDIDKLKLLKSYGINRISVNPQTMSDKTLQAIGRNHSSSEVVRAFEEARLAGFENINMDIILGLENEVLEDLQHTLREIFTLNPESITVHSLALKKASDLTKNIDARLLERQSKLVSQMTDYVYSEMNHHGFKPYYLYRQKNTLGGQENIGFSRTGKESLYNMFIIEEYQNILSFGPGAVSRYVYPDENRIERVSNTKNLEDYIKNIDDYIKRKLEFQK